MERVEMKTGATSAIGCPSCHGPMSAHTFERKTHGKVELDLCFACQGIWFDEFESLQIAPGGIIELFKLIHEHRNDQRLPLAEDLHCPHCRERLLKSMDKVKSGLFNYHRCLQKHGRFTNFAQFMIEKGFVRQLTGAEIKELSVRIDVVRCASCGAPVDIRKDSACGHCRSPIAILDPDAVADALATYHQAETKRVTRDPEALAEGILAMEKQRRASDTGRKSVFESDIGDLVISGASIVLDLLRK